MLCSSPRRFAASSGLILLAVGLLLASLAVARPAHAASYSAGTFQELVAALDNANTLAGPDTINLTADIVMTDTLPPIITEMTIEGNGHTISGNNQFYIFDVEGDFICPCDGVLTLNNATLANGYGADAVSNGSAIFNLSGTVNVNNVIFKDNVSTSSNDNSLGGAISNAFGTVTINNSTFLNNQSISTSSTEEGVGGAIYNSGHLSVNNTTFSGNQAATSGNQPTDRRSYGGAIHSEAVPLPKSLNSKGTHKQVVPNPNAIVDTTVVTVTNSTFSNNQVTTSGPNGLTYTAQGGAVFNAALMSVTNSTFSGNTANASGGSVGNITAGGGVTSVAALYLTNTTLANNNAVSSGANPSIHGRNLATSPGTELTLANNIFAVPAGQDSNCEIFDPLAATNNLQYPDSSCGATVLVANPLLDSGLKNNGGPTQTIALLAGSPAINAADPSTCPATDQRGFARNGICDIGAFEFFAAGNGVQPPSDLVGQLRITPDRVATTDAQNPISYIFTVKNIGQGEAGFITINLPVDPNLLTGYTEFSNSDVWVSSVTTDSIIVSLPGLESNQVVSGTIIFRPNTGPVPTAGTEVSSRYTLKWTNPAGDDKTVWSNAASFEFGGSNTDVSQGVVQLMTSDAPNGTKIVYRSDFWIPDEIVTAWITDRDGNSVELKIAAADADGHFAVEVDAARLTVGTYVIAAHGARSEEYGSGILEVTSSGSSAKPSTTLGVKSLGGKVLPEPVSP